MKNDIQLIELDYILANPYQPRESEDLEAITELAESIERNGLMQNPTARKADDDHLVELAFGHSRLAAYKLLRDEGKAGYEVMPVIVRELTDLQMFEMAVAENIKRRDLNPMEEAHAIHRYMTEFKKTSVEAGEFFNKSPESIRGAVRLVNLPQKAQDMLKDGRINVTTARAVLVVEKLNDASSIESILDEIEEGNQTPLEVIKDAMRSYELSGKEWARVEASAFPVKHLRPLSEKEIQCVVFSEDESEETAKAEMAIVEQMFSYIQSGMEVTYETFPQVAVEVVEHVRVLANPPSCEGCPFHAVLDREHYCGFEACRVRKEDAWGKHEAEQVSIHSGIPLYGKVDGQKVKLNVYEDANKKLVKEKHADLRLVPAKSVWNNFDGIGMKLEVVAVGDLAAKMLKKQEAKAKKEPEKKRQPEDDYELRSRIGQLSRVFARRFIWELASPVFAPLLDGMTNLTVLEFMGRSGTTVPDGVHLGKNLKKADALKQARRYLVYDMLHDFVNVGWGEPKAVSVCSSKCIKAAAAWDVKLPKDWAKQVQKIQTEYDAAKKDVIEKRKAEKK